MGLNIDTKALYTKKLKIIEETKEPIKKLMSANAVIKDAQEELENILLDNEGDCKIPNVGYCYGEFDNTEIEDLYDEVDRLKAELAKMEDFFNTAINNEQAHNDAAFYLKLSSVVQPAIIPDTKLETFYKMCCDISKESRDNFITQMRVVLANN